MKETAYLKLYRQLRNDILSGGYPYGTKLPSKRTLAGEYGVSLVTVEHALEILWEEGYAAAVERSGYFASYQESDGFAAAAETENAPAEAPVTEVTSLFPFSVYAKTMRRVLSEYGEQLLIKSPNAGCEELRTALCGYLARSRGIRVTTDQIIIGAGAEYLYGLAVEILGRDRIYGIETPSYEKIEQVYEANDVALRLLRMEGDALDGEIVALGAAGGEVDLVWLGAEQSRHGTAGFFQFLAGVAAGGMDGGRVAVYLGIAGQHGLQRLFANGGSRGVVQIDAVHFTFHLLSEISTCSAR